MTSVLPENLGHLRPIETHELELMLSWRNAPGVRANMYTRHEISLDEHLAWWEKTQQRFNQLYCMYEHRGTPLGIVAFNGIDLEQRNSSWAFYASPQAPKGTGSKMEWLAVEHGFKSLGLHKIYCEVLAFNEPVIKLHEKFGFTVEGIFREHHMTENGFVNIYRLGMLAREWEIRREELLKMLLQRFCRKSSNNEPDHKNF